MMERNRNYERKQTEIKTNLEETTIW